MLTQHHILQHAGITFNDMSENPVEKFDVQERTFLSETEIKITKSMSIPSNDCFNGRNETHNP